MQKGTISENGFSIVELLVVLIIIGVLAAISGFYFTAHQKLYKPDEQALKIVDMFQEARQRALTQRESMRVELNTTDNIARLIDENSPTTETDDREIRRVSLFEVNEVKISRRADNIAYNPPEPLPVANAVFMPSVYPSSSTHNVCTIRFQSNGTVLNGGNDAIGTGSTITGVTLHIWSPNEGDPNDANIARAVTIIGASGSLRLWEYDKTSTESNKWQDTRRSAGYGQ
jgi:prepilin-type N-terminal cleavage/methylation domain-containing protein